jgi:hypothetical protein
MQQPTNERSWRDDLLHQTVTRHSTKIHEFFGLSPSASPTTDTSSRGRIVSVISQPVETEPPLAPLGREKRFALCRGAGDIVLRAGQFLAALIQSFSPVWSVALPSPLPSL